MLRGDDGVVLIGFPILRSQCFDSKIVIRCLQKVIIHKVDVGEMEK